MHPSKKKDERCRCFTSFPATEKRGDDMPGIWNWKKSTSPPSSFIKVEFPSLNGKNQRQHLPLFSPSASSRPRFLSPAISLPPCSLAPIARARSSAWSLRTFWARSRGLSSPESAAQPSSFFLAAGNSAAGSPRRGQLSIPRLPLSCCLGRVPPVLVSRWFSQEPVRTTSSPWPRRLLHHPRCWRRVRRPLRRQCCPPGRAHRAAIRGLLSRVHPCRPRRPRSAVLAPLCSLWGPRCHISQTASKTTEGGKVCVGFLRSGREIELWWKMREEMWTFSFGIRDAMRPPLRPTSHAWTNRIPLVDW